MKKVLLSLFTLFILVSVSNYAVGSNEILFEKVSVETANEAQAFLAAYYATTTADVRVSAGVSGSQYNSYQYLIVSLDITGTITQTSTGFIVEEDIDGI